jgi:hypothetical protein
LQRKTTALAIFDAGKLANRFPPHLLAAISTSWNVHRARILRTCAKELPVVASTEVHLKPR